MWRWRQACARLVSGHPASQFDPDNLHHNMVLQIRLDAVPDLASRMRTQDACHADAITALVAAEGVHGRMLLSAGRDGVVKAWK